MNDFKTISILITALGGEGGGTLMNWIVECARRENLFVQGTSVPGVAQRTGSTSYYIEICDRNFEKEKEPVLSLYPKPGRVDIVIASELLETARVIERGYVNPDRTTLIASSAIRARFLPSKPKGFVTITIVKIPFSFNAFTTTGRAPEPVPPPMPPVTKTMSACWSSSITLSISSSAARFPISGFAPAPRPLVDF